MSDVMCPYCQTEQEINHDDGYGYEEGEEYEQECRDCGATFYYTSSIVYNYEVACRPEDHTMERLSDAGVVWQCTKCDRYETRRAPDE